MNDLCAWQPPSSVEKPSPVCPGNELHIVECLGRADALHVQPHPCAGFSGCSECTSHASMSQSQAHIADFAYQQIDEAHTSFRLEGILANSTSGSVKKCCWQSVKSIVVWPLQPKFDSLIQLWSSQQHFLHLGLGVTTQDLRRACACAENARCLTAHSLYSFLRGLAQKGAVDCPGCCSAWRSPGGLRMPDCWICTAPFTGP